MSGTTGQSAGGGTQRAGAATCKRRRRRSLDGAWQASQAVKNDSIGLMYHSEGGSGGFEGIWRGTCGTCVHLLAGHWRQLPPAAICLVPLKAPLRHLTIALATCTK